jgi:acetyltransferase
LLTTECAKKKYTTKRVLRNGVNVIFRPIQPADQQKLGNFIAGLSRESLHFRFLGIKKEIPQEMPRQLCNVDFCQKLNIIAQLSDSEEIVGMAQLTLDCCGLGEFALVVADAWQGKGLGEELMAYTLKIGEDQGLCEIHFFVSTDNIRMIALAKKLGMTKKSSDGDTVEMSLQLPQSLGQL